ncbi:MAG TPA: response regulator [Longimicrobiales bacterium]|nr:response regulator [Longimicrobiales bacterium]
MSERMGWPELRTLPLRGGVLIVDDEAALRNTLKRVVTSFGCTVRTAASAEEADLCLNSERFDVCLLDIELPRMKGVEFLEWAMKRDREMAVIMVTGLDAPDLAVECIKAGARTYLVKPISAQFLALAIQDALAVRHLLVERNDLAARR